MNDMSILPTLISLCGTLSSERSQEGIRMPKSHSRPKPALKSYALRLPQDLYEAIENIADVEVRPVNSQMVVLLRAAVEQWHIKHHTEDADTTT
jgi:hypothetical protein